MLCQAFFFSSLVFLSSIESIHFRNPARIFLDFFFYFYIFCIYRISSSSTSEKEAVELFCFLLLGCLGMAPLEPLLWEYLLCFGSGITLFPHSYEHPPPTTHSTSELFFCSLVFCNYLIACCGGSDPHQSLNNWSLFGFLYTRRAEFMMRERNGKYLVNVVSPSYFLIHNNTMQFEDNSEHCNFAICI